MIAMDPGDQPAHREAGRGAHTQDTARIGTAARLRGNGEAVEREGDLCCEYTRHRRCDHAAPLLDEEPLSQPVFERSDLPAHGTMRDAEFRGRLGITGGPRRDFEYAHGIERC